MLVGATAGLDAVAFGCIAALVDVAGSCLAVSEGPLTVAAVDSCLAAEGALTTGVFAATTELTSGLLFGAVVDAGS
ncbi:hypothetical protein [Gallaecimonas sp. GXIMD1310]|uniref:hypothetical protein n=1 Tax=Gallaecimonas sp. GXIMD1310 TaxID=3131926 RepID=UPI0032472736